MNSPDQFASAADQLDLKHDDISHNFTNRIVALRSEQPNKFGSSQLAGYVDSTTHLRHLADAVRAETPSLYADYVSWTKILLAHRGVDGEYLVRDIHLLQEVILEKLSRENGAIADEYIHEALKALPSLETSTVSLLDRQSANGAMAKAYLEFLLAGKREDASSLILNAVERGVPIREIYLDIFQRSQWEVGRLWQENKLSVAQEHYCTAATQQIMSQLYPYIFGGEKKGQSMVATCVSGDLHEIGIRILADFFEMDGWDTYYLGADVPPLSIVDTLIARNANLLAISATMTYHVHRVKDLILCARANPLTAQTKILVGGYPFNIDQDLWMKVGADGCARDANATIILANQLTNTTV